MTRFRLRGVTSRRRLVPRRATGIGVGTIEDFEQRIAQVAANEQIDAAAAMIFLVPVSMAWTMCAGSIICPFSRRISTSGMAAHTLNRVAAISPKWRLPGFNGS